MERLEKVHTPSTAATVPVPDSVPPPGLVPIATVTVAAELVTVLLNASCTVTCTGGEMDAPATAFAEIGRAACRAGAAGPVVTAAEAGPVSGGGGAVGV